jgi:hypothetical protein
MKKMLPALFLCLLAFAGGAQALETDELIAISAMPLAVAEVSALPDVPRDDLFSVIATLNRADVPAPQFIEVVRYAPVALVDTTEPRFVTYVTDEYAQGIVGEPLAVAIADRYRTTYSVTDINVVSPPVVRIVERREILPRIVVTRFESTQWDPLSLVAMPLAVAAVSELTDIPRSDLVQFVTSLNQANMPAPQFIEVVRSSPVVLVDRTAAPVFLSYVRTEVDRGVSGRPLAYAVADRLRTAGVEDIDVVNLEPQRVVNIEPRIVRVHPHGGPPGQLKKQLGLQTGAEVVHEARVREPKRVRVERVVQERPRVQRTRVERPHKERAQTRTVVVAKPQRVVVPRATRVDHGNHGNQGNRGNDGGGQPKGGGHGQCKGKKGKG